MSFLSDVLKAINIKSEDENFINEFNSDDYIPFVVNRIFSNFPDTIFCAQEMNLLPYLDKVLQYKYLWYSVGRRSRFAPIVKEKTEEDLKFAEEVSDFYGVSKKKALQFYKPLMKKEK